MYAEAIDDGKLRILSFDDRWHFVALLCLKAQGVLEERDEALRKQTMCIKLGLDSAELETVMKRLVAVKLVGKNWQPLSWDKRQFQSDFSALRTRNWRSKRHSDVTVTPQEQSRAETEQIQSRAETEQIQSRAEQNSTAAARPTEPGEFRDLKALFPRRAGSQPWRRALQAASARLKEGATWGEILDGARRYAEFCRATGKENTEHVMQAATFCGPDKRFLESWSLPATKADVRLAANISAAQEFMRRTDGTG